VNNYSSNVNNFPQFGYNNNSKQTNSVRFSSEMPAIMKYSEDEYISKFSNDKKYKTEIKKNKDERTVLNSNKNVFANVCQLLNLYCSINLNLNQNLYEETINIISSLPESHIQSGNIHSLIGKCYFEIGDCIKSNQYYQKAIILEPYRLEGLEYFSTVLWKLKDKTQLLNLVNYTHDLTIDQPEYWIILGNYNSLIKEKDTAISSFCKAIQLDSNFNYAYILCALEHIENADFDKAMKYLNTAVSLEERYLKY